MFPDLENRMTDDSQWCDEHGTGCESGFCPDPDEEAERQRELIELE